MVFKNSRDIVVAGFASEADPNTSSPAAGKIFTLERWNNADENSIGHVLVGYYDTSVPTGTAGFTTWFQDDNTKQWFQLTSDTLTHRVAKTSTDVRPNGKFYVQITALTNAGASTKITIAMTEI